MSNLDLSGGSWLGNTNESPQSRYLWRLNEEAKLTRDSAEHKDAEDEEEYYATRWNDDASSPSATVTNDQIADSADEHDEEQEPGCQIVDDALESCDGARSRALCANVDQAQLAKMMNGQRRRPSDAASTTSTKRTQIQNNRLLFFFLGGKPVKAAVTATASSVAYEQPAHVERRRRSTARKKEKPVPKASDVTSTPAELPQQLTSPGTKSATSSMKRPASTRTSSAFSFFSPQRQSPRPPPAPVARAECITCLDVLPKIRLALLDCKHRMCYPCLKRIFVLSVKDPQLMPPKCCNSTAIPIKHIEFMLSPSFQMLYHRKLLEYGTKNRIYCPIRGCGAFIKPKHIEADRATGRKKGTCSKCKTKVCKTCGSAWHGLRPCENDDATKRLLSLGEENGWKRCYRCRTMVQLSEGCNHMKCRCDAEFCMVCGLKWKTCDCSWFNLPPEILNAQDFLMPEDLQDEFQGGERGISPVRIRQGQRDRLQHWEQRFLAPLEQRIGTIPPPPPFMRQWPPPSNTPMDDRGEIGDPEYSIRVRRVQQIEGAQSRSRRTPSPEQLTAQEREVIDAQLAMQLQEAEIQESGFMEDDPVLTARRRANRRARRTYEFHDGDSLG